jgi:formylmethanofuran dehydrogenase subunit E
MSSLSIYLRMKIVYKIVFKNKSVSKQSIEQELKKKKMNCEICFECYNQHDRRTLNFYLIFINKK